MYYPAGILLMLIKMAYEQCDIQLFCFSSNLYIRLNEASKHNDNSKQIFYHLCLNLCRISMYKTEYEDMKLRS